MPEALAPDVTRDALFGGRLCLHQPRHGHRAGTDAVLLAAAVPPELRGHILDAGAGVGAVGLALAQSLPQATVTLAEIVPEMAALARRNIDANDLSGRVCVACCDLLSTEARAAMAAHPADLVVTNPPFHEASRVRATADATRRVAHVLPAERELADWLGACVSLLAPKGTLVAIHQAAAVPELIAALAPRLGALTLLPILPRAGAPATRVLVRGKRGSKEGFSLRAPLVLHDGTGFTTEAAALHAGTATLAW